MSKSFSLFSCPYLDTVNQCYTTIILISGIPLGPLQRRVRRIQFNKLSPFKQGTACSPIQKCGLGLLSFQPYCKTALMTVDELPQLFSFLLDKGYQIDTKLTKMLENSDIQISDEKKLIAFVNYK